MSRSPPQSHSQANPLLNLLNPYTSIGRSRLDYHEEDDGDDRHLTLGGEPESPSTMLLRELQGDEDEDDERERERERYIREDREGMSPTPTPTSGPSRRAGPLAIDTVGSRAGRTTTMETSEDGDGNEPPQSLLYGNTPIRDGERDKDTNANMTMDSPGPFKLGLNSSSTSNSGRQSRSRSVSTSPGPSTISQYASGLEMEGTTLEASVGNSPITSTANPNSNPVQTRNVNVPTFREPPVPVRPGPSRTTSSSRRKSSASTTNTEQDRDQGYGYLDPPLSSSRKGKGKAKSKNAGGRKYHQVPSSDAAEVEEGQTSKKRGGGKQGLNEYEKALWKWVNVDDLDGFLQEVSHGGCFVCAILGRWRWTWS
jgi:autophagy-related protein 9